MSVERLCWLLYVLMRDVDGFLGAEPELSRCGNILRIPPSFTFLSPTRAYCHILTLLPLLVFATAFKSCYLLQSLPLCPAFPVTPQTDLNLLDLQHTE